MKRKWTKSSEFSKTEKTKPKVATEKGSKAADSGLRTLKKAQEFEGPDTSEKWR